MSYHLRNLASSSFERFASRVVDGGDSMPPPPTAQNADRRNSRLLEIVARSLLKAQILTIPADAGDALEKSALAVDEGLQKELWADVVRSLQVVASPSGFGVFALSRTISLKYASLCEPEPSEEKERPTDVVSCSTFQNPKGARASGSSAIVSMGLSSLFSVLLELNRRDPDLCVQALESLLKVLQSLGPDALQAEAPSAVLNMHSLLRQLKSDGSSSVSSIASACMLSLSTAAGYPELLLSSCSAFLTEQKATTSSQSDFVSMPENYHNWTKLVQNFIHTQARFVDSTPNWWKRCLTDHASLMAFNLSDQMDSSPISSADRKFIGCIATDGAYAYVLNCYGLFKLGTGLSETIVGKLYASNTLLKASKGTWLAVCERTIYLRRRHSSRIWVLDNETLQEIGELILRSSVVDGVLFVDSSSCAFFQAKIDESANLTITPLDENFSPMTESRLRQRFRLADICYQMFGAADDASPSELPQCLPKCLQSHASDLHMSKDVALLLARNGKVFYAGNGSRIGLQDTGKAWMELVLPEPIVSLAVSPDSEHIVLRSGSGNLWVAGTRYEIASGSPARVRHQKTHQKVPLGKLRKLHTQNKRRCVSATVAAGCLAYVTENGKAFAEGRHAMQTNPETGLILGLEHVFVVSIHLGKTHAVAVSRQGHAYTWGLNNINQCGRPKPPTTADAPPDSATQVMSPPGIYCAKGEHLWTDDMSAICAACGRCSARGDACPRPSVATSEQKSKVLCPCGPGETPCLRCGICRTCADEEAKVDADLLAPPNMMLPPGRLQDIKVAAVSCGNYHTIILAADRRVFTFGSNCHGQLGTGDTGRRETPHLVELPADVQVVQVAAGANHCVLRTADGRAITFGAYRAGQLGREGEEKNWHAKPGFVAGYGTGTGTSAGWVGASGDNTFIHTHRQILTKESLADCQITANKNILFVFPSEVGKDYIVMRRHQNLFHQHQLGPRGLYTSFCFEPNHDLMFSYNAAEMRVQMYGSSTVSPSNSSVLSGSLEKSLEFLRAPEFLLPLEPEIGLSDTQLAISILMSVYVTTVMATAPREEVKKLVCGSGEDADQVEFNSVDRTADGLLHGYNTIGRFQNFGGGWGYSAHSVEAIQFQPSVDVRFYGVGLFGGRGEYIAKLKLFGLVGEENDEHEIALLSETDEMLFECVPREKAPIQFPSPVMLKANHWYVVWAQINGPSSDCGSNGLGVVKGDDGVQFTFRNSRLSNNGTDLNVGQIPDILYRAVAQNDAEGTGASQAMMASRTSSAGDDRKQLSEISLLTMFTSPTILNISPSALSHLLDILKWSVTQSLDMMVSMPSPEGAELLNWKRERCTAISTLCMRVIGIYVNFLYSSSSKADGEDAFSDQFARLIGQLSTTLSAIFELANQSAFEEDHTQLQLMEEALNLYVSCNSVLLPSPTVILDRLACLMSSPLRDWALVALMRSLCEKRTLLSIFLSQAEDFASLAEKSKRMRDVTTLLTEQIDPKTAEKRSRLVDMQNVIRFLFEIAFVQSENGSVLNRRSTKLKEAAHKLIVMIAKELILPDNKAANGPPIIQTPNRYRRTSSQLSWDLNNGSADAIAFKVEVAGLSVHGVGAYVGAMNLDYMFTCEVLQNSGKTATEEWCVLEKVMGTIREPQIERQNREVSIVRLHRPVRLQPGVTYAVRLSMSGGKTYCGENGVSNVRISNGSKIQFLPCSLSVNGTSVSRGQVPFLLYSVADQEEKTVVSGVQDSNTKLFLILLRHLSTKLSSLIVSRRLTSWDRVLCCQIAGYATVLMESNAKNALDIMATLDELLPMISSLNGGESTAGAGSPVAEKRFQRSVEQSTSRGSQVVIESPHPYRRQHIHSEMVSFDSSVEFVSIDFADECCTVQPSDALYIYVADKCGRYIPVGRYSGLRKDWPERMILIPGNSLWFVLETGMANEDLADDLMYGYRCTVSGFTQADQNSNQILEQELTWICANACRLLVQVSGDKEVLSRLAVCEEETNDLIRKHGSLLRKGLNLSHIPSVHEVLTRNLPQAPLTQDLKFLREFMRGSLSSVAGTLSKWLMHEAVVDVNTSELGISEEEIHVGKPVEIRLIPKDQYGRYAESSTMNVEVNVRSGTSNDVDVNASSTPSLEEVQRKPSNPIEPHLPKEVIEHIQDPFRPTYLNKARYMSITMMPIFADYTFEELRLAYLSDVIMKDSVKMSPQHDACFVGEWCPRKPGTYRVECRLDGFQLPQSYVIDVSEAPHNHVARIPPSNAKRRKRVALSRARFASSKSVHLYKGVRIRSHPALNAAQIGMLPRDCVVSYIEQLENADGVWLRLADETISLYCTAHFNSQAWCLQKNKHLNRTYLTMNGEVVREKTAEMPPANAKSSEQSVLIEADEIYEIVPSPSGVVVFDFPSTTAHSEVCLRNESEFFTDGWIHNREGVWLRLKINGRYVRAQDDDGKMILHRKHSLTKQMSNGNEEDDALSQTAEPGTPPLLRNGTPVKALKPAIVDCCRSVFAAFLWHERLVKDAMACATFLRCHPELQKVSIMNTQRPDLLMMTPAPLQSLIRLWKEIMSAVLACIEQNLILPSPPAVRQLSLKPITNNLHQSNKVAEGSKSSKEMCDLCEEWVSPPVATHMKMAHPGCGGPSGGHGFNSFGKYSNGWSGVCGYGGTPGTTFYLMCQGCRRKHMKLSNKGIQQERTRRWREFRMSNLFSPETVIKQNAMFLLELNSTMEMESKDSSTSASGWVINLFPTSTVTPTSLKSVSIQATPCLDHPTKARTASTSSQSYVRNLSHASDPGPKQLSLSSASGDKLRSTGDARRTTADHIGRGHSLAVLQSPSVALKSIMQKGLSAFSPNIDEDHMLLSVTSNSMVQSGLRSVLQRPVLAFVIEHHDLRRVREACSQAVVRAILFTHTFRVWNWLLRLVSSESSVLDVIWHYLTALSSYAPLSHWFTENIQLATKLKLLPHPWRICFLAGPIANSMVTHMHSFLYTIAVILQSNGVSASLRCLCFKAWTFQLTAHEQDLLMLVCNVLSTVAGVLSDGSADSMWMGDEDSSASGDSPEALREAEQSPTKYVHREMADVSSSVAFESSSRQAMVVCLTDGNYDTFWESGDEDKKRPSTIGMNLENVSARMVAVYVDNLKDVGFRTASLSFQFIDKSGIRQTLHATNLEMEFIGWVKVCVTGLPSLKVVIQGYDQSVRIRQISTYGFRLNELQVNQRSPLRPSPSHQLLFSTTQIDAFALFQAIASQAFGDEFAQDQNGTLRQQVLDLLFSRVQLQPLQTYVCMQMVNALEREVATLRERFKRNYSYACGLMVMLVKICGSRKGLEVFSVRNNLLITLSELLLFAPQVVQCQVIETIERLICLFKPSAVDTVQFLENLLACIAKVVTLQIKDKASHSVQTATVASHVVDAPSHWRIDRATSVEIGRLVRNLVEEVASSEFNENWALAVRTALANNVMKLVRYASGDVSSLVTSSDSMRSVKNTAIVKSAKFWISMSALSLIKDVEWLQLSPMWIQSQDTPKEPDPLCDNHDDGFTTANVYCEVCDCSLCKECFTVLHLNKRNRNHSVQIVGSSNVLPQVDVHEACTRFRLGAFLILFHGTTFNGMVEFGTGASNDFFAEEGPSMSRNVSGGLLSAVANVIGGASRNRCRFCTNQLSSEKQMLRGVCNHEECLKLAETSCKKTHPCGHLCCGIVGEEECLQCLQCRSSARQDADDLCVICFTDRLGGAPCVQLKCSHIFHFHCVKTVLEKRWVGPRIVFQFMQCPLCRQQIDHPNLADVLRPLLTLHQEVASKAKLRLEYDGLLKCPALTSERSEFFGQPELYAMDRYMYVLCFKCNKAYFGGESRCQEALESSQYNPEELICGGCSDTTGAQVCARHGVDYLEYKCRFCCSVAVYFCFGTTHFCASCHDDFQRLMCLPKHLLPACPAGPKATKLETDACPLKVAHPPSGEEFALGCGACRNLQTF
ncbi:hypothetical protein QR680_005853 [Steinernema hermaphroditum]|uniref:RCR-type E3 ubiquitin transferase n=1 Tax=Steinernema hermaphroditum TaxID=289476 RepID=A0AA39LWE5_9BILA|nr:hypothetical protein QR680_005853 [Steinernema hermaphroditum]